MYREFVRVLAVCLVVAGFINFVKHHGAYATYSVCTTANCIRIGIDLKYYIDKQVDPCDDFYKFVCGRWIEQKRLTTNVELISEYSMLQDFVYEQVERILKLTTRTAGNDNLQYAQNVYTMCKNMTERDKIGLAPLHKIITDVGGWPMTDRLLKKNGGRISTWQGTNKKIDLHFTSNGLYDIRIDTDLINATRRTIYIKQPNYILMHHILIGTERYSAELRNYRDFIRDVAWALAKFRKSHISVDSVAAAAARVQMFESAIAKISSSSEERKDIDKMLHRTTIAEFQKEYDAKKAHLKSSQIDWLDVIRNKFSLTNIPIDSDETIIVYGLNYFLKISQLLDATSTETIVNYIVWQFVYKLLPFTTTKMYNLAAKINTIRYSTEETPETENMCAEMPNLSSVISFEYVKRHFSVITKTKSKKLLHELKKVLYEKIKTTTWMDDQTKRVALEKAKSIIMNVGHPDWYRYQNIGEYYEDLNHENFFEAAIKLQIHDGNQKLAKLRYPPDREEWYVEPIHVEASYNPAMNCIILPAAILQGFFFDPHRPASMNYGTMGYIIGHELTHGYDSIGRKFDKNGSFMNWWTKKTSKAYTRIMECFIKQYDAYDVEEVKPLNKTLHVNGRLTFDENIGDGTGIEIAWKAWTNYKKQTGTANSDVRLPSLENYNGDKLFFISLARAVCEKITPSAADYQATHSDHPLWHTRIIGSLSNSKAFAKVFNCPKGTPMNPKNKCQLWS